MKIQRIYIDTSVIGGCHDEEFYPWSKGLFKDFKIGTLKPVISELVKSEIIPSPEHIKTTLKELIELDPEVLTSTTEVLYLLDKYIEVNIIGPKHYNDMNHIALATVADVDILTSWNFKHIVHYDKIQKFNAVNIDNGYKPIKIYSPREGTNYEEF